MEIWMQNKSKFLFCSEEHMLFNYLLLLVYLEKKKKKSIKKIALIIVTCECVGKGMNFKTRIIETISNACVLFLCVFYKAMEWVNLVKKKITSKQHDTSSVIQITILFLFIAKGKTKCNACRFAISRLPISISRLKKKKTRKSWWVPAKMTWKFNQIIP